MLIIPAIDIIKGRVVRLYQGNFNKVKFYSDDPVETALLWQKKGASFLHIVDLDGAKYGESKNLKVVASILETVQIPCEVGGGLRTEKDIEYLLKHGASRVVVGTKAFEDREFLEGAVRKFREKIVVSIDISKDSYVAKTGWLEKTHFIASEAVREMQNLGVETIIVTDISRDGTLSGPDIEKLKDILNSVNISVIASGGVSCIDDIKKLKAIGSKNLEGVIIGKALYEGKIDLEEAIKIAM
jgi:phosphoribosylformimino-5-aminoimidazole carboxamide ribotide isomerase